MAGIEFTPAEVAYLQSQRLGRIATASPSTGQPDVAAVTFQFDGHVFFIGGFDIPRTLKYRNVQAGNQRGALVVDDLAPGDGYHPRGVKVHGRLEIVEGPRGEVLRLTPLRLWAWGLEATAFVDGKPVARRATATDA